VKYDLNGVKQSTWQAGSTFDDEGAAAAVDGSGNVLVAGTTNGGYTEQTTGDDAFLVKFDASGAAW
jgi:Beta-propeller repeat